MYMESAMEDKFLDIRQAAIYLDVAQSTLRWHMQEGRLPTAYRDRDKLGRPAYFKQSDLDDLANWAGWIGRKHPTPNVKERSPFTGRNYIERPLNDEVHKTGCTIHWSERFRFNDDTFVPVTCAECGKKFEKRETGVFKTNFTGCCTNCYCKRRKVQTKNTMVSAGKILRSDGYIYRHIRTFTEDEQAIIKQMPLNNNMYISEHRAVVSLHFNRPLLSTELVHHIDGDKTNNDISNLHIYQAYSHSRKHSEQFAKVLELESRVGNLELENSQIQDENSRLRKLLEDHNIVT
jgi:hypothetical protein